ncbi:hypothetical protein CMO83_02540 [Candidatus Woesearchaeota archaeon]|nr:hypothetical protein [Candidatus Woesearchaeota archaeon]|tara:strand:- start:18925 stop:20277 length:1353 start_codon:yes stop_codon:yes gene_type:complete
MIPINVSLSHYKRSDIQEEIIANSKDREIAVRFNDKFSKRPDTLRHKNDVLELAKQGATSFHASEELWRNALQLDPSMRRHELDNLRSGWDLVIDIDCGIFDYSKIAADLVIKALKFHKLKSVSCKFSGNKGFHIGVPFQAFPDKIRDKETKNMFPEAPKKIAMYIKNMMLKEFGTRIMEFEKNDFNKILEKTGKKSNDIIYYENKIRKFNPESILEMDTLLISPRHLYRMPYSLHEKSGLVSTPLNPEKVMMFKKEFAIPKNVRISRHRFLGKNNADKNEAKQLLTEALDFSVKKETVKLKKEHELEIPQNALPEELFPPCVKLILDGLDEGRKRGLFTLINYFTSIGWDYDMIEKKLKEWNAKNKEPLREVYLLGQLKYHKQMRKRILPPNCDNEMYMVGIGVCKPDSFCSRIKNPAQYTTRKAWLINRGNKGKTKKGDIIPNQKVKI